MLEVEAFQFRVANLNPGPAGGALNAHSDGAVVAELAGQSQFDPGDAHVVGGGIVATGIEDVDVWVLVPGTRVQEGAVGHVQRMVVLAFQCRFTADRRRDAPFCAQRGERREQNCRPQVALEDAMEIGVDRQSGLQVIGALWLGPCAQQHARTGILVHHLIGDAGKGSEAVRPQQSGLHVTRIERLAHLDRHLRKQHRIRVIGLVIDAHKFDHRPFHGYRGARLQ